MSAVKIIVATEKLNGEKFLGTFLDESHFDVLIESDCDFYAPSENTLFDSDETSESKCVFKFRKGFFSAKDQSEAYLGLIDGATQSQNRGLAAGSEAANGRDWVSGRQMKIIEAMINPVDSVFGDNEVQLLIDSKSNTDSPRGSVWLSSKVAEEQFEFESWALATSKLPLQEMIKEASRVAENLISKTSYANQVFSGIAGYFNRYPRIPYGRATTYTRDNNKQFERSFPFLRKLSEGFKDLLPERFAIQESACTKIDPEFYIPGTPFTTLTINKTFRTAAHLDAGDLSEGFSNLSVLSNGKNYTGGYLVLPEYRAAVNIRPGDLLLISNHDVIHGNTEIKVEEGGERLSLVCYFREGMLELGSKAYEDCRCEFVESRRKDVTHPMQRPFWNGVSPGMWNSKDWYDFLLKELGWDTLVKYHPEAAGLYDASESCAYKTGSGGTYDCSTCPNVCTGAAA